MKSLLTSRITVASVATARAGLLTALFTALLTGLLTACTPALDWREHRFDEGGFTILFPQKPGRAERKLATPAGEVTMKMVSVRVDETVFGAASADFASAPDAATQEAMRNALLKNFDGTIISDQPVSAGPLNGREVIKRGSFSAGADAQGSAKNGAAGEATGGATGGTAGSAAGATHNGSSTATAGELRARFFVKGNRYYQLIAVGRRNAVADTDLDLFFTSFKPD